MELIFAALYYWFDFAFEKTNPGRDFGD